MKTGCLKIAIETRSLVFPSLEKTFGLIKYSSFLIPFKI